ncbi:hypothetical protein ABZW18_10160 [Streptomyces sp. NPDC004647]|uniref:hypothetical protein n=1 Tax=Streptomyces sp. NPDC004647 TaxID=3154671 RepID=UPI0033B7EFC4
MAETITYERLEELLDDESIPTVHRALWLLLWEGELRVLDLLSMDVGEADPEGDFSERAAGMLREMIGDRETGPLFAEGERALSWERAVQVADEHGHRIHMFRTGGKRHRQGLG